MATKTKDPADAPAAVTEQPTVEQVETPIRSRRGLKLGAFIAGGVLAAAMVFGGGVLLGAHLPHGGGQHGMSQGQLPGGERPPGSDQRQGGQRP